MPSRIANSTMEVDSEAHTITLTRRFAAPCQDVFEAWTRPEHVTCWWDPTGEPLAECEIDLRPGGAFRFVSRHPEGTHSFTGAYCEIAPPHRLVFKAMGAIGRVAFEEADGKTLLTVKIECCSAEQFEQYLKMGIDTGTARTLDNLFAYAGAGLPRTGG
jgi:uncharacterized protein YndB with AHSA1/START domain